MTLAEELTWRGLINQTTFADVKDINEPRTFYFGVDPSAPSMTVGNLAAMMLCRHFIDHGYKPLLLVGGATGMIGDPDGKKQERDLRNAETVARNVKGLAAQFRQVFRGQDFEIVDNADWFSQINYIDFLHKIGKHISMTQLLDRETVEALIDNHRANPGERALQKTLAREVTDLVHGRQRRESVERVTAALFGGGDIAVLNDDDLNALANEIPTVDLETTVVAALVAADLCASNGEARRLIQNNAISVNGAKIAGDMPLTETSLIKKGKNDFLLVK